MVFLVKMATQGPSVLYALASVPLQRIDVMVIDSVWKMEVIVGTSRNEVSKLLEEMEQKWVERSQSVSPTPEEPSSLRAHGTHTQAACLQSLCRHLLQPCRILLLWHCLCRVGIRLLPPPAPAHAFHAQNETALPLAGKLEDCSLQVASPGEHSRPMWHRPVWFGS